MRTLNKFTNKLSLFTYKFVDKLDRVDSRNRYPINGNNCQWKSIFGQLNKTSVPQVCVLIVWAGIGRFIHTIRITCSLWNCCWKDDLISRSLLYYLNSGYCWHARILRSTRHFQMCYPYPNECNWSLWYLVGTCWRRRTTASTAHGCAPVE
jgi:hypothetical protein